MKARFPLMRGAVLLLGLGAAGLAGWRVFQARSGARTEAVPSLPSADYGPAPAFSLRERGGRAFGSADLKGKVWVADFIFTRCGGPCPIITAKMKDLQEAFAGFPDIRLVSFSVDPAYDTPEVLAHYADRYGARPDRWYFLTGETGEVYRLVLDGFRLAVRENAGAARKPGEEVTHSLSFVLVDRAGRIRGYYTGTDPEAMERLRRDAQALL